MDKNIIQKIILENQELVEQIELVERHFFLSHILCFSGCKTKQVNHILLYQRMNN